MDCCGEVGGDLVVRGRAVHEIKQGFEDVAAAEGLKLLPRELAGKSGVNTTVYPLPEPGIHPARNPGSRLMRSAAEAIEYAAE